jgi:hypothetical protein
VDVFKATAMRKFGSGKILTSNGGFFLNKIVLFAVSHFPLILSIFFLVHFPQSLKGFYFLHPKNI